MIQITFLFVFTYVVPVHNYIVKKNKIKYDIMFATCNLYDTKPDTDGLIP